MNYSSNGLVPNLFFQHKGETVQRAADRPRHTLVHKNVHDSLTTSKTDALRNNVTQVNLTTLISTGFFFLRLTAAVSLLEEILLNIFSKIFVLLLGFLLKIAKALKKTKQNLGVFWQQVKSFLVSGK